MLKWHELVPKSDAELAEIGIANVNLACAMDLPGSQSVNHSVCTGKMEFLAKCVEKAIDELMDQYDRNPLRFGCSKARLKMMCLMSVLQRNFGVCATSKLNDRADFSDGADLFIHGILEGKPGTCSNLPVLVVAVGRRLGYPLKLAQTTKHLFARWDDPGFESFNIECTVLGFDTPSNDYYLRWPAFAPPELVRAGQFLKSLTPREELGGFLLQRSACLQHNGRFLEAADSCVGACLAASGNQLHRVTLAQILVLWEVALINRLPPLFPRMAGRYVSRRRYPSEVPTPIEDRVAELEILQATLDDPQYERDWWRLLRQSPRSWPSFIPTSIDVSRTPPSLFHIQEQLS